MSKDGNWDGKWNEKIIISSRCTFQISPATSVTRLGDFLKVFGDKFYLNGSQIYLVSFCAILQNVKNCWRNFLGNF